MDQADAAILVVILVVIGFIFGFAVGFLAKPDVPKAFQCTESVVIEGSATCVKYERNK